MHNYIMMSRVACMLLMDNHYFSEGFGQYALSKFIWYIFFASCHGKWFVF